MTPISLKARNPLDPEIEPETRLQFDRKPPKLLAEEAAKHRREQMENALARVAPIAEESNFIPYPGYLHRRADD